MRVSIAPAETARTALLGAAYLAAFFAAARVLTGRPRRRLFLAALFLGAFVQIALAVLGGAEASRLSGSFVNPNHLAGYLEIALAFAFALLLRTLQTDGRSTAVPLGERFERRAVPVSLAALLWATLATGLALTRSRGGLLAASVTTGVLFAVSALAARSRQAAPNAGAEADPPRVRARLLAALPVALALVGGILFVAATLGGGPFERLLGSDPKELAADRRVVLWKASVAAFRDYPLLGSGLGTFREAFRRVQPPELVGLVEQAHSEPLQLLVTAGALGALLAAAAAAAGLRALYRALIRKASREEQAIALGGLGAFVSLLLHGLAEFNFSLPAIPATLAAALGLAWAAAAPRTSTGAPESRST